MLLIAGYILTAIFCSRSDAVSKGLYEFILMNSERLQNGETLTYLGSPINTETQLVRYRYCFSYFIATSTRSSGLYIVRSRAALTGRIISILITLTVGWWGIPWGPIMTVKCIYSDTAKNGDPADTVGGILRYLTDGTSFSYSDR
ncbi:MAG: hypothetical protein K2J73_03230 [Oscillospiraceae bacterium]|nr:hypothetical protein [Oscillospiraceae bacterium]